jgi:hypothetical protein
MPSTVCREIFGKSALSHKTCGMEADPGEPVVLLPKQNVPVITVSF